MMKRCPDQDGFSLVELMVAIGILAIGAAMVASAFPVAMLENKESVEYTMGALISENALAICRNRLRHCHLNGNVTDEEDEYTNVTTSIALPELAYPMPRWVTKSEYPDDDDDKSYNEDWFTHDLDDKDYPTARYGWMVGARQVRDAEGVGLNDYELSIVVYEKLLPTDRPGHELKLDDECKNVDYVPEDATANPNPRNPTIGRWVVRTSLRP